MSLLPHPDLKPHPRGGTASPFLNPGATEDNAVPAYLLNRPTANTTADLELEGTGSGIQSTQSKV